MDDFREIRFRVILPDSFGGLPLSLLKKAHAKAQSRKITRVKNLQNLWFFRTLTSNR
jgi:hypothetical protein